MKYSNSVSGIDFIGAVQLRIDCDAQIGVGEKSLFTDDENN